jgi:hypothetical protein
MMMCMIVSMVYAAEVFTVTNGESKYVTMGESAPTFKAVGNGWGSGDAGYAALVPGKGSRSGDAGYAALVPGKGSRSGDAGYAALVPGKGKGNGGAKGYALLSNGGEAGYAALVSGKPGVIVSQTQMTAEQWKAWKAWQAEDESHKDVSYATYKDYQQYKDKLSFTEYKQYIEDTRSQWRFGNYFNSGIGNSDEGYGSAFTGW